MKTMITTLRKTIAQLVRPQRKAIAGALSGALTGFFTQTGVTLDADVETALYTLIFALVGYLLVWVSPANEPNKKGE